MASLIAGWRTDYRRKKTKAGGKSQERGKLLRPNGSNRGVRRAKFWVLCEGRASGDCNGLGVKYERKKSQG